MCRQMCELFLVMIDKCVRVWNQSRGRSTVSLFTCLCGAKPGRCILVMCAWAVNIQFECRQWPRLIPKMSKPLWSRSLNLLNQITCWIHCFVFWFSCIGFGMVSQWPWFWVNSKRRDWISDGFGFFMGCLQVMRVADKGCDIVRITVQGKREADACYDIKNTLVQKGWAHAVTAYTVLFTSFTLRAFCCNSFKCVLLVSPDFLCIDGQCYDIYIRFLFLKSWTTQAAVNITKMC